MAHGSERAGDDTLAAEIIRLHHDLAARDAALEGQRQAVLIIAAENARLRAENARLREESTWHSPGQGHPGSFAPGPCGHHPG